MSVFRYVEFFIIYILLVVLLQFANYILSIQPTITNSLVALIISVFIVFKRNKVAEGIKGNKVYFFWFISFIYLLCSLCVSYYVSNEGMTTMEGSVTFLLPFVLCLLLSKFKVL